MTTIRKAVIPVAGLGTRFLPVTKSVPKELLPIVDRPTIDYIVAEAAASGIEEILFIISREKNTLCDYFDHAPALEAYLSAAGKKDALECVRTPTNYAHITTIRQDAPRGLGHAIGLARSFAAGEPIAVLLGDDVVISDGKPALAQLIEAYQEVGGSIVGVQEVAPEAVEKYGIIQPKSNGTDAKVQAVQSLMEKPQANEAPSRLAVLGRYILSQDIFDLLEGLSPGKGNEIQLTDALNLQAKNGSVHACVFSGRRYDLGDRFGFLQANIELALAREDLKTPLTQYLSELTKNLH